MPRLLPLILLLTFLPQTQAAPPPAKPTTLSGLVKNKDNSPAPNTPVRLYESKPDNTPPGPTRQPPPTAETATNDKGEFKFDNLPPGNYRVVAGTLFKDSASADVKLAGKPQKVELTLVPRKSKL